MDQEKVFLYDNLHSSCPEVFSTSLAALVERKLVLPIRSSNELFTRITACSNVLKPFRKEVLK